MLSVYSRHYPPCSHADINHRRCRCPKWIQGTLPDGRFVRESAKTRSWEKAEIKARAMEDVADPHKPSVRQRIAIEYAIQCFRDDEKSRHLSKDSQRKSEFFFGKQLKMWAEDHGFVFLDQLPPATLTNSVPTGETGRLRLAASTKDWLRFSGSACAWIGSTRIQRSP